MKWIPIFDYIIFSVPAFARISLPITDVKGRRKNIRADGAIILSRARRHHKFIFILYIMVILILIKFFIFSP